MAVMVVAHPVPGFSGRVAVEEVGLVFVGGFTGPTEVPTEVQAQLVGEGFTLNAVPNAGYPLQYVTHADLDDPDSEPSVALRAALVPRPSGGTDGQALVLSGSDVVWSDVAAGAGGETIGTKLRRLAGVAATRNPFALTTLAVPADWAASTAYTTGQVRKNGANTYICVGAGTSAASGGPTITTGRPQTDGTAVWSYMGPATAFTADPGAPAYSSGTSVPGGLTSLWQLDPHPNAFRMYGAYSSSYFAAGWTANRFNSKAGTVQQGDARIGFMTDAPKFAIGAPAGAVFRVRIDGRLYSASSVDNIASGTGYHTFDFTASGGRKARQVEIDLNRFSFSIVSVSVDPLSQVWAPPAIDDVRAVFISDSLFAGSAQGPFAWSAPQIVGAQLGWSDCWNFSTGGTGWINPAASLYTFGQRIPEALTRDPDVWVFHGSMNDASSTAPDITAAVLAAFQAIRTGGSEAPIIVLGVWSVTTVGLTAAAIEAAIQAAVTQFDDDLTFFIPIAGDSSLAWVTSDNLTMWTGNDNIHPADIGTRYFSDRIARAVRQYALPNIP